MERYSIQVQLRWSDIDANFHLRHSAYYDFGAMARIEMFSAIGLTENIFQENGFGPILFREEAIFRKEVRMHDKLEITAALVACRANGSRFHIQHQLLKEGALLAAEINVWGDWLNTKTRKLYHPPAFLTQLVLSAPKSMHFQII